MIKHCALPEIKSWLRHCSAIAKLLVFLTYMQTFQMFYQLTPSTLIVVLPLATPLSNGQRTQVCVIP